MSVGNVICLPKSGSSFVNKLLGKYSIHEYDHQIISNLVIEMYRYPSKEIANYYLATRRKHLYKYVDISTTKIFLLDYFSTIDYSIPTLFILRNPCDWCRSILSYSLDIFRLGQYHDWVHNYQSIFLGKILLSDKDLSSESSLSLRIHELLPRLFECWFKVHKSFLYHIHSFENLNMLNTSSLSNNCTMISRIFGIGYSQINQVNRAPVNCSTESHIIREKCEAYFSQLENAPIIINRDSLSTFLYCIKNFSKKNL